MKKNCYAIIRIKTGKLIIENERVPVFWNKKNAEHRAKDFIGVKVIPVTGLIKYIHDEQRTYNRTDE